MIQVGMSPAILHFFSLLGYFNLASPKGSHELT
jgi:hypothetical protein